MEKIVNETCVTCGDKLIGQKFGSLTVVGVRRSNHIGAVYICSCDCGHKNCKHEVDVHGAHLKKGCTKTCGGWYETEDLIGKKFNNLTVLERVKFSKVKKYLCTCDCGHPDCLKLTEKIGNEIVTGTVKSCGVKSKRYVKDLAGERFGRLTVLQRNLDKPRGSVFWDCICDCGNKTTIRGKYLRNGDTRSCGCLHKEDISKLMYRGGKNKVWYDDYEHKLIPIEEARRDPKDEKILQVRCTYCNRWYTPTRNEVWNRVGYIEGNKWCGENRFYHSEDCKKQCPIFGQVKFPKDYQIGTSREVQPELRKLVLERDGWKCTKCTSKRNLHCHHIEGICWEPIESADIDKCMTLCEKCHKKIHKQPGCRYVDLQCNGNDREIFIPIKEKEVRDSKSKFKKCIGGCLIY